MIEVLNKKNDRVRSKYGNNICAITFTSGSRISFTGACAELCNLRVGSKVHFLLIANKSWCFYVDNEDNAGYSVFMTHPKTQNTVAVNAKAVNHLFRDETKHKMPARFYVTERGTEYFGKPIYEILTNKPINELGK